MTLLGPLKDKISGQFCYRMQKSDKTSVLTQDLHVAYFIGCPEEFCRIVNTLSIIMHTTLLNHVSSDKK